MIVSLIAVEQIVRNTTKEEFKRRMSHGEILKLQEPSQYLSSESAESPTYTSKVNGTANEYKTVMNGKSDYFKANIVPRSQSSSSNTSR